MKRREWIIGVLVGMLLGAALVWAQSYYKIIPVNTKYLAELVSGGTFVFDAPGLVKPEWTAVEVDPGVAVTFDVSALTCIALTATASSTGLCPIGGVAGQVILIRSGTGADTMRFDDGTSTTLGGDVTLTEGENDVLCLKCVSAEGDVWTRVWSSDN